MDKNKVSYLWIRREIDKRQRILSLKIKAPIRTTFF